jgi:hypothetical protein
MDSRAIATIGVGIVGVAITIGAFVFLPDPQSLGVGSVGVLITLGCVFLRKVSAEPAVGTSDAPEASSTKDYTGGGSI